VSADAHRVLVASRTAASGDAPQVEVVISQNFPNAGMLLTYGGVDPLTPIDNDVATQLTAKPLVAPSVLTLGPRTLPVRVLSIGSQVTFLPAAPLVERASVGVLGVFEGTAQNGAGPTGTATIDVSNATVDYATLTTLALKAP
jgi:hypothetical protein